jgi:hypothetical protein
MQGEAFFLEGGGVETRFCQKVCLEPNCLVMWESQCCELCGLRQIAVHKRDAKLATMFMTTGMSGNVIKEFYSYLFLYSIRFEF